MKERVQKFFYQAISLIENKFTLNDINGIEKELTIVLKNCFHSASNLNTNENELPLIDAVIDRLWEKLNTGYWKDVPINLRDLYGYSSYVKTIALLKFAINGEDEVLPKVNEAVTTIDMGLLLGSSLREEFSQLATSLCQFINSVNPYSIEDSEFCDLNEQNFDQNTFFGEPIPAVNRPSLESFLTNYFIPCKPLKLLECINHWPALKKWKNIRYICSKIGPRTVPVEIGSSYTSSNWSQKMMTVQKFIENFMLNESKEIGYLAQHQLFNQIPELLDDIREPEYCTLSESYDEDMGTDVNAWFGPCGTVSPLHYDPKHNLLTQVVGVKRVLLIHPKFSDNVYPHDDHLLFNTAQVDLENPDYDKFPKLKNVEILKCILMPGDMLYIPPKWWHHVRSLSPSFSVSFWWGTS